MRPWLIIAVVAAVLAVGTCCADFNPVIPPVVPTPPVQPPPDNPPDLPPDTPPDTPEDPLPTGLPQPGMTKAQVQELLGTGIDLPENPGEDDLVVYRVTLDGKEAEVHVVYSPQGTVVRAVVSYLITSGGSR